MIYEMKTIKFETTKLRKNCNKLCRDMFIAQYNQQYTFVIVRNGSLKHKEIITTETARKIIDDNQLIYVRDDIFNNAGCWRTKSSWDVINNVYSINKKVYDI